MWPSHLWGDLDRQFATFDELRRRMSALWQDLDYGRSPSAAEVSRYTWPRANIYDTGNDIVVQAVVPGLSDKDLQLSLTQDTLAIAGERRSDAPEGYSVHRQERAAVRFSRSFALPAKVDVEKCSATVKNGILTVRLSKAAEAKPRQITVKAAS